MYVCNLIAFLFCVMFPVGLTEGRIMRKRRDASCEHGNYTIEGKTCCQCPPVNERPESSVVMAKGEIKSLAASRYFTLIDQSESGSKLLSDCTDTHESVCDLCDFNTYLDHPNHENNCQACKICEPEANMEVEERCSRYSNTICRCQKDHYCDQGEHCRMCKPCDTCDEVETKCTETSNTVCKDVKDTTMSKGAIAAAVLVPSLIIICLVLFYLWKQKKNKKNKKSIDTEPEAEQLKELDLNPYLLPKIADHLGWKVMKRVALHSGMTTASVDNHECNYPNDAKEQTYRLLLDWSQRQGLYEGYPALIKTLHAINERKTADEIKKIVEKGQANAQP